MKNKKGLVLTFSIIAGIGLFLLALILIITLVASSSFKIYAIGGALIVLPLVFGLQGEFNQEKGRYMTIFIVIGGALILLNASGVLQNAYGTSSFLAISNVEVSGQDEILIYARSGGAEELIIDFDAEDITSYIENEGLKATKDVSGRITFEKQDKKFEIQKTTDYLYLLTTKDLGVTLYCSSSKCESEKPPGYQFFSVAREDISSGFDCICIYKKNYGNIGIFSGFEQNDFLINFKIGSQSNQLTSDRKSIDVGPNARVTWEGNLLNNFDIDTPPYDVLFYESQNGYLISKGSESKIEDSKQDYIGCINNLYIKSESSIRACATQFNNEIMRIIEDNKNEDYENNLRNKLDGSIKFSENNLILSLKEPDILPTFKIYLDADYVGIVELMGEPSIISCIPTITIDSGDKITKNLVVKNIGEQEGLFQANVLCTDNIIATSNDKFVPAGLISNIPISISGENTEEKTLKGTCSIVIKDQKSLKSDTCNFFINVEYDAGKVCEAGESICFDINTKQVCNSDGTDYSLIDCDYHCKYENNEAFCIDKTEEEDDAETGEGGTTITGPIDCRPWERYIGKQVEIKSWYNYIGIGNPRVYTQPTCTTAPWVYLVGGGVFLLLIIYLLIPKKNVKSKRNTPTN